jgi:hypothetical protein
LLIETPGVGSIPRAAHGTGNTPRGTGGLQSLIHSVQRVTYARRLAVDDTASIRAYVHTSEDPRVSGYAAETSAVLVLRIIHADPGRAHIIGPPDCTKAVTLTDGEESWVVAARRRSLRQCIYVAETEYRAE